MTMFKKLLPLTLALALFGLALNGCEEDVLGGDEAAMKAEVDGNDWNATSVDASGSNTIVVTATNTDATAIILTIPGTATVGEHKLPAAAADGYAAGYRPNASTTLPGVTGDITIDAISATQVSGTFEFDATDGTNTVEIRDGSFVANRN